MKSWKIHTSSLCKANVTIMASSPKEADKIARSMKGVAYRPCEITDITVEAIPDNPSAYNGYPPVSVAAKSSSETEMTESNPKYSVLISAMCYSELVVEASSEKEAKEVAAQKVTARPPFDYCDAEILDVRVFPYFEYGYQKKKLEEPLLILEPEDWTADEWKTLCKFCGFPEDEAQRIVLHVDTVESSIVPN